MPDMPPHSSRGVLFPERLPVQFRRVPAGEAAREIVQWWWFSQWDLSPGEASRQELMAFPSANVVIEPSGVGFWGPTTHASHRDLSGRGWVLGALLHPAAIRSFTASPAELLDQGIALDEPGVVADVGGMVGAADLAGLVAVAEAWLCGLVGEVDEDGRRLNQVARHIATDPSICTVEDCAAVVHLSARSVHRLVVERIGLTPGALIRRRRIQEAAAQIRDEPARGLAQIAFDNGFTDQAHLTREFRALLGRTPAGYRSARGRPPRSP